MRKYSLSSLFFIIFALVFLLMPLFTSGKILNLCNGPYKDTKLSVQELEKVIENHDIWTDVYPKPSKSKKAFYDKLRANLCKADLSGTKLSGVNLSYATLKGADLSGADLSGADLNGAISWGANLSKADLTGANLINGKLNDVNLSYANLSGAYLAWAQVSRANLKGANLSKADLGMADLSGSDLSRANLSEADLRDADLSRANLSEADLRGAILIKVKLNGASLFLSDLSNSRFYPEATDDISIFLGARGLSNIEIENVTSIVNLREKIKEAGFKSEEKSLTSALRKYQLEKSSAPERLFWKYLLGGIITDFGANPVLALYYMFALIFVFIWFYLLALRISKEKDGIWRVRPANRLIKEAGESERELVQWFGFTQSLLTALYFSFLSAFHFGWRELNISNWIVRIQKREYTLLATGWVRTVSGIQSLISLYLVALFLLTYFGNPYE